MITPEEPEVYSAHVRLTTETNINFFYEVQSSNFLCWTIHSNLWDLHLGPSLSYGVHYVHEDLTH